MCETGKESEVSIGAGGKYARERTVRGEDREERGEGPHAWGHLSH